MMRARFSSAGPLAGIVLLLLAGGTMSAGADEPLVVATNRAPPFVILDGPNAGPAGLTVSLVESIAKSLGRPVVWRPMAFGEVLGAVARGEVDMAAGAISVTAEREQILDFSHPYVTTGLGIAVRTQPAGGLWAVVHAVMSRSFLEAIGALVLLLGAVGFGIWLVEHRTNREQFGGGVLGGVGKGFWWAAVTMATVGYGDKVPQTVGGRLLGVIWMFSSVILISSFTAAIASGLTVTRLEGAVSGPRDLPRVRVATVDNTAAPGYLDHHLIRYTGFPTLSEAIDALLRGDADALVYDAPLLRYRCSQRVGQDIKVLDTVFARQNYAIALPMGSRLRKPVNTALLSLVGTTAWAEEVERWLPER